MPSKRVPTPQGYDLAGNSLHYSYTDGDVKYFVQGQNHHHAHVVPGGQVVTGGHVVTGVPIIAHGHHRGHHHGHAVVGGHGGHAVVGGHGGPVLVGSHGGPAFIGGRHGGPVLVGGHGAGRIVMIGGIPYMMG